MSSAFGGFGFVCVTEEWYNTYYIAVLIVESDFLSPEPQNNYFTPYAQITAPYASYESIKVLNQIEYHMQSSFLVEHLFISFATLFLC